ncbi:MAG: hypothetical protein ACQEXJ_21855 [Myxococcota bacterium]
MIDVRTRARPGDDDAARFEEMLGADFVDILREHPGACYGLWSDLHLAWTNPAWDRFAADNDGSDIPRRWGVGADVGAALGPLRRFYLDLFEDALTRGDRVEHTYECSSPTQRRVYRMSIMPVGEAGLVIRNTCVSESAPGQEPAPPSEALLAQYRERSGRVVQCAHCRRTRRVDRDEWDWVPALVKYPAPMTSHGLCTVCMKYHYPGH